ncbi:MAG: S9 family peptidase [Bacteroidetes bacterium]|nr:MAG: S9 family peptidase [Bacteroidota bacterium]
MNRIYAIFLILGLSMPVLLPAQSGRIDLEAAVTGELDPERLGNLQWIAGETAFSYIDPAGEQLFRATPGTPPAVICTLADLQQAGAEDLTSFPSLKWEDPVHFLFWQGNHLQRYHLTERTLTTVVLLPDVATLREEGPGLEMAFTIGHNVYAGPLNTENWSPRTEDGGHDIRYGEAASRFEFGITKGLFWSPDGQHLAFYRIDQRAVYDCPFPDYNQFPAQYLPVKYPMAGDSSQYVQLGILNLRSGQIHYLQVEGPYDQYLTNITWHPDGRRIYVVLVNRAQDEARLQEYDATTGALLRTLFTETNDKYVEPEHGPIFIPGEEEEFLWFSERDGYQHLYHYRTDGTLLGQLTEGDWEVSSLNGFDEKGKYVFLTTTQESPLERHLYRLKLKDGSLERLTTAPGVHRGQVDPSGRYLLDTWSSRDLPGRTQLFDIKKGEVLRVLHEAANPLAEYELGEMEIMTLEAEDGTPLYARLIKPVGFDPAQRYPAIVYLYNGPHVQLIQDRWLGGAQLFLHHLAQSGYVVLTVDGRGSAGRGLAFEQAIYRQLGTAEMQDQLQGVAYLKAQPWVDADRLGVYGWSYGGFMTTSLMLRQPGTFAVGVAGGPVIDWRQYEVMYTERYMDTPQENPEGYEQAMLVPYVDQLQGQLLVIHGLQDSTVLPQHSLRLIRQAEQLDVQIDYYPYPTYPHNVRGRDRAHLLTKIRRYFDLHLQAE